MDGYPNLKEFKSKPDPSSEPKDAAQIKATSTLSEPSAAGSKRSRKRAADFLSENEDEAPEVFSSKEPQTNDSTKAGKTAHEREKRKKKKAKKAKRDSAGVAETLTADGVNGVTEKKESAKAKTTTAKTPAVTSMQAEAQHTAEQELEDEWGGISGDDDAAKEPSGDDEKPDEENGAHLLAGFDSDASDKEDKDYDGNIPGVSKKGRKLLNAMKNKKLDKESGVVYLGRIPHGFYEAEMRGYLGQYGDITRLRLSRNKRTGASKHFAFIEFESSEVARIVAEANNNYMMFGHRLKCSVVNDPSKLHEDVWKGANKKFRRIPHQRIEREKLAAPKSVEAWEKKNQREQKKRDKKAKELKETIGYEMPEVKLKDPKAALEEAKMLEQKSDETVKAIEEVSAQPTKSIEAAKETPTEPITEPQDAAAPLNGDVKGGVVEVITEIKEPEAAAEGDIKAVEDSSNLSKEGRKALKKAKKAKAKAEAAQTNGAAAYSEVDTSSEPKKDTLPPADTKSSTDAGVSGKSTAENAVESSQEKQIHQEVPPSKDLHGQNERKRDKKDRKKAKLHEQKDQPVAEAPIKADRADKKAKKSKSAA